MAQTNNHITYTAADLMLYAQGKMPPQHMHALEKAALEDPFLAEALDGYIDAHEGNQPDIINQTLQSFKNKIGRPEEEKKEAKIIPVSSTKWWKYAAAAAAVLFAGGWLVVSLNQKQPEEKNIIVAKNETIVQSADSVGRNGDVASQQPSVNHFEVTSADSLTASKTFAYKKEKPIANPGWAKDQNFNFKTPEPAGASSGAEVMADEKKAEENVVTDNYAVSKPAPPAVFESNQSTVQNANGRSGMTMNNATSNNANNFANSRRFTFNGKVVDANNNPLPYSNVTIPGEGVGTYSDAKGNFNFVYVDSSLPVRARSLGFEEKDYTMQPDTKENRIVLREDEELKKKMVVNKQEKQARTQLYKPLIIERDSLYSTAEPSVGWNDYNIYALNNSRAISLPAKRSVELSFDVSKTGEVENITVDKSSGKELDEEAIRLLKEGPKWKAKKGAKTRAKVTLKF